MRVAALDLGSNTSLLLIADVEGHQIRRVIRDETTITKLGQGVHAAGRFHPEALARMDACLKDYAQIIKDERAEKIIAVATSAARDVENGAELIAIGKKHGLPILIIDGEREAQITFRGAQMTPGKSTAAVIDVGGGSTEIIGEDGHRAVSVNIGSVRLTELYITRHPVAADEIKNVVAYIDRKLEEADLPGVTGEVIAVSGTPTTLAAIDLQKPFAAHQIQGRVLTLNKIEDWAARMAKMTLEERERLPGMQPKRADVIVVGALILAGVLRALKQTQVTVSVKGVRYGVALSWQDF